ncbi:MAG TPA: alpha/beta hydrolase [Marmoricola sp.]|nr:alpha/beta hydrolase [Marmoricola sp.]
MAPTSTDVPRPDVLGGPYVADTLHLAPDEEGEVVATLVHRPAGIPTRRAVLHVHGFCDYFFQTPAADFWVERGYDFYALDLRKYGRSLLPHQTPNYTADLRTYGEELSLAWARIRRDHDQVVLSAHSTGGLTVPLWAAEHQVPAAAFVLNAPWLDMHGSTVTRTLAMPAIQRLGAVQPRRLIPRSVSGLYGRSLHRDFEGEWDFDLAWKPLESWPVYAGWIRAIRLAHHRLTHGLELDQPVLVLSSTRSGRPASMADPDVHRTDIVLDVEQIRRRAALLGRHVTLNQVAGARHDVTLSRSGPRGEVFDRIDRFLTAYVETARA